VTDDRVEATWWADDPILSSANESLGRQPFVRRVIDLLGELGVLPNSSVVALVGPWGSGKTSTANLILDGLDKTRWGVARVNPWALGSADALARELLGAVGSALPRDPAAKRARKKMQEYATAYAAPILSMLPVVGGAAEKIAENVLRQEDQDGTLQAHFERVASALLDLCQPILIIVDDVDRLQPDELLALFRAVRVLGRLPYVHYVIAYDQRTIMDLLKATPVASNREDRALAFLEKVVTLPIDQPAIRDEQSSDLFNEGLGRLVESFGIRTTEKQRRRLSDEWELLLSGDLAQPRGIRRILAQLQIHLPLIGPHDIDLVDYIIATHLRLTYPMLHEALRVDRALLVSDGSAPSHGRADRWRDTNLLNKLGVAEDRREAITSALQRLFPVLGSGPETAPRSRGIDNPDYVDRYFTFVPGAFEATDADLLGAMIAWQSDVPVSSLLASTLSPVRGDRRALANSARIIRRLAALSDQLSAAQAAVLLRNVLPFLPLPHGPDQFLGGPDAAITRWLSQLIAVADVGDVCGMLDAASAAGVATLVDFLRAVASTAEGQGALWQASGECAWRAFLDNVRCGDDAPTGPTELLFGLADQFLGTEELNQRLRAAVDTDVELINLAARLVVMAYPVGEGSPTIFNFDAQDMIRRLGLRRVASQSMDLGMPRVGENDREFHSWPRRRFHASVELAHAIDASSVEPQHELPSLPADAPEPFTNHRIEVLDPPGGEVPDLKISVTALTPAAKNLSVANDVASALTGGARETVIIEELNGSRLTEFLTGERERWPFRFGGWKITDPGDGRVYTAAAGKLHSTAQISDGWRQETPVLVGAQVRTGTDGDKPFLISDYAIGLWLVELDSKRSSADRRNDSRPLPAAYTIRELYVMLYTEIYSAIEMSLTLYESLLRQPSPNPDVVLRVSVEAQNGIDSAVNLEGLSRTGRGSGSTWQVAHFLFNNARDEMGDLSRDWAVALISEWLMRSGYRSYESTLQKIVEREARK
jgi:hypothetical protein